MIPQCKRFINYQHFELLSQNSTFYSSNNNAHLVTVCLLMFVDGTVVDLISHIPSS